VPAPPAVSVTAPAVVIVPAKSPAVPDPVDVWLLKFDTVPAVGADVANASPCVKVCEKLKLFPAVFWVASIEGIAPTPVDMVNEPIPSDTALPPVGVYVVSTPEPDTEYDVPILSTCVAAAATLN